MNDTTRQAGWAFAATIIGALGFTIALHTLDSPWDAAIGAAFWIACATTGVYRALRD